MKASKFQFSSPELLEVYYKVNESFDSNEKLKLEYFSETLVKKSDDEHVAEVVFTLRIFKEEDFLKVPFVSKISIRGYFHWDESIEDKVDSLLKVNAPATLLSYIRPLITQFTSQSGYPPLILPLIDFTKAKQSEEEEN